MSGPRVLVVDDDEAIRAVIDEALSDEGYCVLTARDGADALRAVTATPPDLILLDMRMPVMDGWAFARAYRELPGPHAPIVVVTAAEDAALRATQVEAEGYLAKPFEIGALLAAVEHHAEAR